MFRPQGLTRNREIVWRFWPVKQGGAAMEPVLRNDHAQARN
jgi:hypothetical protein